MFTQYLVDIFIGLIPIILYHLVRGGIGWYNAKKDAERANYRVRYSTIRWCASKDNTWGYHSKSWNVQIIKPLNALHDSIPRGNDDNHYPSDVFGGPGDCVMNKDEGITTMHFCTAIIPPKGLSKFWVKKTLSANWTYFFQGPLFDLDANGEQAVTSYFRYGVKKVHLFIEVPPMRKINEDTIRLVRRKYIFRGPADRPGVMTDDGQPCAEGPFEIPRKSIFDGPLVVNSRNGGQCIIVGYNVPGLKSEKDSLTNELIVWGYKDTISWEWQKTESQVNK